MKTIFLLFCSIISCFGQAFTWHDLAMVESQNAGAAFQPSDVAGLKIWLKSESLSALASEGGSVSNWPDSSGNNYYFTNDTLSTCPYLTNTFNGQSLSALFFDGTDDWLRSSNSAALSVLKSAPSASVIAVVHLFNTTSSKTLTYISRGGGVQARNVLLFDSGEQLQLQARTADGDGTAVATVPAASSVAKAICLQGDVFYTNSTMLIYTNNVLGTNGPGPLTTNTVAATDSLFIQIGSSSISPSSLFKGMMAEILIYVPAISSVNRDNVFAFLTNKFKISL